MCLISCIFASDQIQHRSVQQSCKFGSEVWRFLKETNRSFCPSPECQYARFSLPACADPGARPHNASAPPTCFSCESVACGGSTLAMTTMLASLSLVLTIVLSVLLPCAINAGRSRMIISCLMMCCFILVLLLYVCLVPIELRINVRRFLMHFAMSPCSGRVPEAARLPRTVITGRM